MSDVKAAIMDAAERRMQQAVSPASASGKSPRMWASKARASTTTPDKGGIWRRPVIRRWAEYTSELIDKELEKDPDPVRVWTKAFRGTAYSKAHMCPCAALATASQESAGTGCEGSEGLFQGARTSQSRKGFRQAKQPKCCRPSRAPWSLPMPSATLPSMTEHPRLLASARGSSSRSSRPARIRNEASCEGGSE